MSGDRALSLEVIEGRAAGVRVEVLGRPLEIGRAAGREGRLGDDPELSRNHARVTRFEDGRLMIEDLGSTNGTFVNGKRIAGPTLLEAGHTVNVGDTTLRVVAERLAPAPREQAPREQAPRAGVHTVPSELLPLLVARAPVKREWIVRAFLTALPIVLAVNFIIRTIAVEYLDVPSDTEVMKPYVLFMVSLMPTLGNCIGFYFNFGRPANRATWQYLVPTFMITVVITTIEVIALPGEAGFAEYGVTILVSGVAPTVIVPMLLALRVRAALHRERELAGLAR
jgi:pSer/pThr/pTyr-binding forkhead associated (FHA) protein